MPNVLVTMRFTETQLDRIRAVSSGLRVTRDDAKTADYADVDVLYAWSVPRDLSRLSALKWIQLHAAGVDAFATHPVYAKSEILLTTTSGVHAATIAEYAITTMLALAHRVPRMVEWHGRGTWPPDEDRWRLFVPTEIRGATMGIIGYGSIGRELARLAKAFGMKVLACKRNPAERRDTGYNLSGTGDPEGQLPDGWFSPAELRDLLAQSDVVVMSAPLTPETRGMIAEREIAAMKPSAYFINVGRGATVDESALAKALADKRIAGAVIDVFSDEPPPARHPFYELDNVIVSPHVSGFLPSYDERCSELFAENLRRFLAGAPLLNLVDRARGY